MPRANRHYLPGYVWHITHRCHDRQHLLKFSADRNAWIRWLSECRKRFGLSVLDFSVTHNHIHMLVFDTEPEDTIPSSMQLLEGSVAQAFNRRRGRRGAFWEDRYHATAVQSHNHLLRCIVYIDLNMVRAGAVAHPREWPFGGYAHIHAHRPKSPEIIDTSRLVEVTGTSSYREFQNLHVNMVESALEKGMFSKRDEVWSTSVAVGDSAFIEDIHEKLGNKARHRAAEMTDQADEELCVLREEGQRYENEGQNPAYDHYLTAKNTYRWNNTLY